MENNRELIDEIDNTTSNLEAKIALPEQQKELQSFQK